MNTQFTHDQIWAALHPTNSFKTIIQELSVLNVILGDIIPSAVLKQRVITRGKNAGFRRITYNRNYVLSANDIDKLFVYMTGLPKSEYVALRHFIQNEKGQTMFSLVLNDDTKDAEYVAHWHDVYNRTQHLRTKCYAHLARDLDMNNY